MYLRKDVYKRQKVGHALGAQKKEDAASYAQSSIQMGIVFAIGFGILSIVFADEMIGFFQLNSAQAVSYTHLKTGSERI